MSFRIDRRPQAQADVDDIAQYIANDNVDAAIRFIEAVERAVDHLAETPRIGRERPEIVPGLRSWPIHGFTNYIIFYFVEEASIDVVRVLHGARHLRRAFGLD